MYSNALRPSIEYWTNPVVLLDHNMFWPLGDFPLPKNVGKSLFANCACIRRYINREGPGIYDLIPKNPKKTSQAPKACYLLLEEFQFQSTKIGYGDRLGKKQRDFSQQVTKNIPRERSCGKSRPYWLDPVASPITSAKPTGGPRFAAKTWQNSQRQETKNRVRRPASSPAR